ncbi:hypothetical protein N1027_11685 [Herbiconiux sp. CPCC 205763]|uniref:DUF4064 domain-containing protein n=1 Tax=Herbiconiux aconitum TaxID=2970913 RepID=A0ABT2GRD9_9MICO|nr:hypothetical protein [Herbiconiux aconitum]MCS5718795.1 hypothetical protein [Herbiconiux aconitum]
MGIVGCMSVLSPQTPTTTAKRRSFRVNRVAILALGVIVVPFALTAMFNSYGALTEESAIRMAFATVGGQTVAILSGAAAFVITAMRRRNPAQLVLFFLIAVFIVLSALGIIAAASDLLLTRLDLIAETDLMNR